jgi:acetoin utilization protein AcuB
MLVKDWMTDATINVTPETSVVTASEFLRRKNIRQLPVIDDAGELVGIVSDRDIRDAMPSKYLPGDHVMGEGLAGLTVQDIMALDPLTISPEAAMESAADILLKNKFGALPVLDDDGLLVGVISQADIFKYLCSATGVSGGGIQLIFKLSDAPGEAIKLLGLLRGEDVRLISVMTSYEHVEYGFRHVSIRVRCSGKHSLESLADYLREKNYELLYYIHDGKAVTPS